ncbi:maleylpyruvate isomerase family mycothiol-dependent enzyme [Pseudonocardia endophytica]|uniref:Uncharacterized protein (TIGR03083 family) n=1 Tax=Pseudonocardia endophytica TaxID=401976 RepID=A0A4R1I0G5_PSEEN|nr:maleylpyruvate isomerase family mycothiol-dependent enzyme [Pseudonocardia endophytica]TCK27353.1 uncharacterized protein (TIGR03083 family) [Pseudonocardia endophytica]
MPTAPSREAHWAFVHAERAALAEDLAGLTPEQWAAPSLCGRWSVEEVVAHLTAAASIERWRWLRSMIGARFDDGVHNDRRLAEHRGATPSVTLERFRAIETSTTGPTGDTGAWLGEIVVHGQDIRRPLGLQRTPSAEATTEVARFFASRNFTVASRSAIEGLRVEATDEEFATGDGPLVRGTTLALVMAMAGRSSYLDDLTGPGVETLRSRIA